MEYMYVKSRLLVENNTIQTDAKKILKRYGASLPLDLGLDNLEPWKLPYVVIYVEAVLQCVFTLPSLEEDGVFQHIALVNRFFAPFKA